jgi:hypothetical protein
VLDRQPLTDVVISVDVSDATEAAVDRAALAFTPADWDQPQTVTITAVDDPTVDGTVASTVTLAVVDVDSDDAWDALGDQSVALTTLDDETAGFSVTITGNDTTVAESGTTDVFDVVLDHQPLSDVIVTVTSSDAGEATVDPSVLTFTSADWNQVRTVTVKGEQDGIPDGTQTIEAIVAIDIANSDDAFDGVPNQTVIVVVQQLILWQSYTHPCDVNADGFIEPVDLLLVIDDVNTNGSRTLPTVLQHGQGPPPYVDVSGDGDASPVDMLHVISYLNAHGSGPVPAPEGEPDSWWLDGGLVGGGEGESAAGRLAVPFNAMESAGATWWVRAALDEAAHRRARERWPGHQSPAELRSFPAESGNPSAPASISDTPLADPFATHRSSHEKEPDGLESRPSRGGYLEKDLLADATCIECEAAVDAIVEDVQRAWRTP